MICVIPLIILLLVKGRILKLSIMEQSININASNDQKYTLADNKNMDITKMNVPSLIRSSQYFHMSSFIKNYEDTLQKIFYSSKDSQMIYDPNVFLWRVKKNEDNCDLFPNVRDLELDVFGIILNDITKNIVIMGPYVRSCFVENDESNKCKIRKEIYLYRFGDDKWSDLIDLSSFDDKKTEYVFQNDDKKICLVKKKYKSPSHIIMQHGYLKRCGWYNNAFYVSSMFLIEMQKHSNLMASKFKDPILNLPYDPLEVYTVVDKDKTHPAKIIDLIDNEDLFKVSKKNLDKLYNNKTCLEICLDKYLKEDHPILVNNLKQMILYLSTFPQRRLPIFYAELIGIDKSIPELFKLLKSSPSKYGKLDVNLEVNSESTFKNLDNINNIMINILIKQDVPDNFNDYLHFCKQKVTRQIVDKIISCNSKNIASSIVTNNMAELDLLYYLILMMEDLELTKKLPCEFDVEHAMNYMNELLENCKVRSFYFLYELDSTVINTLFDNNRNVLHQVTTKGNYVDMIKIIMKLNPDLINVSDLNKETPLIYHAKHNPELLEHFLDNTLDGTIADLDGNIFLHHLCKHDNVDILRNYLKQYQELIDMPNKKSETPIIVACLNGQENMFYTLKTFGADLKAKDYYGNTIYHYICASGICLGMIIENTQNYFGLTPLDYCKISSKYWNFTD